MNTYMTIDVDTIQYIRDELLSNPNILASDVYEIAHISEEYFPMYTLMVKWMEEVDSVEREMLYEDMIYLRNKYLENLNNNIISFPRRKINNPPDKAS